MQGSLMPVEQWFPTTVIYDKFDDVDLDRFKKLIDNQVESRPDANTTGHWSGFNDHKLTNLHLLEDYKTLTNNITKLIKQYIEHMGWDDDTHHFQIDRMWANSYQGNEIARKHFHSGLLSGCFYLDEGHDIVFHNPLLNNRPEFLHTQVWTKTENFSNANSIAYKSEPGKCILWPGALMHETRKNNNNITRSIAFDVWCYSNRNYYFPKIS
jgi:uncharacterized protein (TIGR02466 family)